MNNLFNSIHNINSNNHGENTQSIFSSVPYHIRRRALPSFEDSHFVSDGGDEEQIEMGLSKGIIRLSVGIDDNIEASFEKMKNCMNELGILKK